MSPGHFSVSCPELLTLTLIEVLCRVWPCFPQEPHWKIKMVIFGGENHNLTALSYSMTTLLNTLLSSCWSWVSERLWHRSWVCLLRLFTTCASRGAHPGHPWKRKTKENKGKSLLGRCSQEGGVCSGNSSGCFENIQHSLRLAGVSHLQVEIPAPGMQWILIVHDKCGVYFVTELSTLT